VVNIYPYRVLEIEFLDDSLRVAFQGERGAYSELPPLLSLATPRQPVPYNDFDGVFEAVTHRPG